MNAFHSGSITHHQYRTWGKPSVRTWVPSSCERRPASPKRLGRTLLMRSFLPKRRDVEHQRNLNRMPAPASVPAYPSATQTHITPSLTGPLEMRSTCARQRYKKTLHSFPLSACFVPLIASACSQAGSTKIWSAMRREAGALIKSISEEGAAYLVSRASWIEGGKVSRYALNAAGVWSCVQSKVKASSDHEHERNAPCPRTQRCFLHPRSSP